jgi:general L-amino acid transport system permease protein
MQDAAPSAPPGRPAFYNDPRVRGLAFQLLALAVVVAVGWYLISNTMENLARLGVSTGFGFLDRPAGFDISQAPISFSPTQTFARAFLVGLLNTAILAVVGIVIATVLGFLIGMMRLSRNWLVAKLGTWYVEIFRNIPVLLQLIFFYKLLVTVLPDPRQSFNVAGAVLLNNRGLFAPRPVPEAGFIAFLVAVLVAIVVWVVMARIGRRRREQTGHGLPVLRVGIGLLIVLPLLAILITGKPFVLDFPIAGRFRTEGGMTILPEFVALCLGLSIYTASYIAEIVRSGILAVSHGQTEASMALGLSRWHTLRLIIVPQAMRIIVPPLTSQYLNLTKNSSLGIAIGYPDFFSIAGTINNQTGQAVEVIAITMGVYLALSLITSAFMNWYNARIALIER